MAVSQCAVDGGDMDNLAGKPRMVLKAKRRQSSKESTGHQWVIQKAWVNPGLQWELHEGGTLPPPLIPSPRSPRS